MVGWPIDATSNSSKIRVRSTTVTAATQIITPRRRTERKLVSKVSGKKFGEGGMCRGHKLLILSAEFIGFVDCS